MKLETNLSHTPFCTFGLCGRKKIISISNPDRANGGAPSKQRAENSQEVSLKDCRKENTVQLKTGTGGLKTTRPAGNAAWQWLSESQGSYVLHHKVHTCILLKSSSSAPGLSKARAWEAEVRPTEASGRSPGSENCVLWPQQTTGKKPLQLLLLPHPSLWSRPSLLLLTCPAHLKKSLDEPPLTIAHSIQDNLET